MYTVKEVADKMNISEHTIRFWAKSGFFPFIKRSETNIRLFDDHDLEWVKIVKCLRVAGVENKEIKRYIDLCLIGDSTVPERYSIIQKTKEKTKEHIKELTEQISLLEYKEAFYKNIMENNLKNSWNPINNITIEEKINL